MLKLYAAIKRFVRCYKHHAKLEQQSILPTRLLLKAMENYFYLPKWAACKLQLISLSWTAMWIEETPHTVNSIQRLYLTLRINDWINTSVCPKGVIYERLTHALLDPVKYRQGKPEISEAEYITQWQGAINGINLAESPFTSALKMLLVIEDIDWPKFNLWITEAERLDNDFRYHRLRDNAGDILKPLALTPTAIHDVKKIEVEFNKLLEEYRL